nr:hypothetical protein [Streptomyces avermitilis]
MTRRIEEILSRALLVRHRTVPRDIVPFSPARTAAPNPLGTVPQARPAQRGG